MRIQAALSSREFKQRVAMPCDGDRCAAPGPTLPVLVVEAVPAGLWRGLPSSSCKGTLFRLADEYQLDCGIYTRLLRDPTEWLSSEEQASLVTQRDCHVQDAT